MSLEAPIFLKTFHFHPYYQCSSSSLQKIHMTTLRAIAILSCMLFFLNFYFDFFGLQAKIWREMNWQIRFSRYTLHFSSAIDLKQSFWQDRDFNTDSANYILLEAKLCSNWATTRSLVPQNNSFLSAYFNNF